MSKLSILGMGAFVAVALVSCKSSESAYKKAYENAKQQEFAQTSSQETVAPVQEEVAPVVAAPVVAPPKVVESTTTTATNGVREEKVTVVSGTDSLKDYNVVAGSFSVKANAESLKDFLDGEGYQAMVAFNAEIAMYRVIVATYHDRASAAAARDAFKAKYPNRKDFQGAWLLYRIN